MPTKPLTQDLTSKFANAVENVVAEFYQQHSHNENQGIDQKVKAFIAAKANDEKTGTLFKLVALATDPELKEMIVNNQQIIPGSDECRALSSFIGYTEKHPDSEISTVINAVQKASL